MGAADLSPEARARAKAQEQVGQLAQMPEHVIYANSAGISVQADGSICLRFEYDSPAGTMPLADVIIPAATFAGGILGNAHRAMNDAAAQLAAVTEVVVGAVAKRAAMMGGTAGGSLPGAADIAAERRRAAGDGGG
jgi:hypothetical protein